MAANGSKKRNDVLSFELNGRDAIMVDLGGGYDVVNVAPAKAITQVRLTFTSSEVGNDNARDSDTLTNQDGGLAVRLSAEAADGSLKGPVSRFDDEGISFVSDGTFTFDVRDLVSGAARGDQFVVARLGTAADDLYSEAASAGATYINAGAGNDTVYGGDANDFLVGGAGNDMLFGRGGNNSFIGGGGNDMIVGAGGNDTATFNVSADGSDMVTLGRGADTVNVLAAAGTSQVRLTFTSAEVGNGSDLDSNTLVNQDGGLAVRLQAENGTTDELTGLVSRFDDEGIRFVAGAGVFFDVRDLVSGAARGNAFGIAELGTDRDDQLDRSDTAAAQYINAGAGNDTVTGGTGTDFLVGGIGDDRLNGGAADDILLGGAGFDRFIYTDGAGSETIADFLSGTDRIDLRAFGIAFSDISITQDSGRTLLSIDTDGNGGGDFTISLTGVIDAPVRGDFVF